jgi:outer membrane protein assembly factor BamB
MRLLCAFLILAGGSVARAGDWPQWLGPNRDGASPEKVTPWKTPPKVLWRQAVAEGHSSPVVAGGQVFLHTRGNGNDEEALAAFDTQTGKLLWRASYPRGEFTSVFGSGPRATPAVSGSHIFTVGVTGVLTCFEVETGKQFWQVDTLKKFEAPNLQFGVSCSPLVEGDKVLLNVGGKGASVVAFNKQNGEVAWKALDDRASYSSPIAIGKGSERQLIFLTADGLVSLRPDDGKLFWRFPLKDALSESSTTPVRAGDLLIGSSVTAGSVALRVAAKDSSPDVSQVWKNPALTCYFSTPVPVGKEHVYMVNGSIIPPPQASLRCVETATGKVLWHKPRVGKYHASLLRTGDDKLLMLDDAGNLVLLDPNPKEYRELARAKVCGETWAHPALSDGKLYIRDAKELICLEITP